MIGIIQSFLTIQSLFITVTVNTRVLVEITEPKDFTQLRIESGVYLVLVCKGIEILLLPGLCFVGKDGRYSYVPRTLFMGTDKINNIQQTSMRKRIAAGHNFLFHRTH